jgi:hypothetical protein
MSRILPTPVWQARGIPWTTCVIRVPAPYLACQILLPQLHGCDAFTPIRPILTQGPALTIGTKSLTRTTRSTDHLSIIPSSRPGSWDPGTSRRMRSKTHRTPENQEYGGIHSDVETPKHDPDHRAVGPRVFDGHPGPGLRLALARPIVQLPALRSAHFEGHWPDRPLLSGPCADSAPDALCSDGGASVRPVRRTRGACSRRADAGRSYGPAVDGPRFGSAPCPRRRSASRSRRGNPSGG